MNENTDRPQTINALSSRYALDRRTLRKYLADTPPAEVHGSHKLYRLADVEKAIERARTKPLTPKAAAEVALLGERLRKLRRENDTAAGELVRKDELGLLLRRIGRYELGLLRQELEVTLPARLAGLNPIEIGEQMKKVVDKVVRAYRDGLSQFLPTTENNTKIEHETPNTDPRPETPSNPSPNQAPAGGGSTTQGTPGTASA